MVSELASKYHLDWSDFDWAGTSGRLHGGHSVVSVAS